MHCYKIISLNGHLQNWGLSLCHFAIAFDRLQQQLQLEAIVCALKGRITFSRVWVILCWKLELDLKKKICKAQAFSRSSGCFIHSFEFVPV